MITDAHKTEYNPSRDGSDSVYNSGHLCEGSDLVLDSATTKDKVQPAALPWWDYSHKMYWGSFPGYGLGDDW